MNYPNFPFDSRAVPRQAEEKVADDFIDLDHLVHVARRQAKVLAICAAIGLAAGLAYLQTTPPTYVSTARVLIDEELSRIVDDAAPISANFQSDAEVASQVEVLRSARLAEAVVTELKLDQNENFLHPPTSLLSNLVGQLRGLKNVIFPRPAPEEATAGADAGGQSDARRQSAVQTLLGAVRADRVGRSFVIAIAYQSHDPKLAAAIAGAYADAYVADQLNASFDAAEQATVWLQNRLTELQSSSQAAALEAEQYKAEHGLATARGEPIAERQLGELTAQLSQAQADTARARARYEQYSSIARDGSPDAIGQAMANSIVSAEELPAGSTLAALRTHYLNIAARQRQVEANYGAEHPQAVALGDEAAKVASQILSELKQLTQSYRNEYDVALARETSLRQSIAEATGESAEAGQSAVKLRELEQRATALGALYQTFLDRYERTTQQQSFPVSKARIISAANAPRNPSSPRTVMVLGLSLVLGLMLGGGLGALNEFNERFFRTGKDVTDRLGFRFLGYLPLIGEAPKARRPKADGKKGKAQPPQPATPDRKARLRMTLAQPSSMFSETLRNVKIASDVVLQNTPGKVIGVVSALPGEGKSTVAANLAQLLAANNSRTLLIDGDLRRPALTRALGIETDAGVVEAIVDTASWRSRLKFDRETKLAILPGVARGHFSHTSETLASPGMRQLIQEARGIFHHIVVDLPPAGPVVDAKAFAPLADGFVVVVEWGRTPRALVRATLAGESSIANKVLGVVLNKVRLNSLAKYGSLGGSEQFLSQYQSYYLDGPKPRAETAKAKIPAGAGR
jgi:succinoglycan biosynthesis transport protein ExoP